MKSDLPKVLHPILGKPIINHVISTLTSLEPSRLVVILGHCKDLVEKALSDYDLDIVIQERQLGTGHAVMCAREHLYKLVKEVGPADVLIVCGDTPLLTDRTLKRLLDKHRQSGHVLTVLSSYLDNPASYGRIVRDDKGNFLKIVEERDADPEELAIKEVNAGVYVCNLDFLFHALSKIKPQNSQSEYYLTDIISVAVSEDIDVSAYSLATPEEILGVNSRIQLSVAEHLMLDKLKKYWMARGVTFELADSIYIESGVSFGYDVVIGPCCTLRGLTKIGDKVKLGAFSYIENTSVASNTVLAPYTVLTDVQT